MCKMFEVVTGRKSKGSVDKLEGLTKAYTDMHEDIAIIRIPVELMEVDSRYQTDERTERDLKYLTNNWDERKLMPLLGVPHWEEGKVYIVDGYGRWIASQIVDKDKYKDLKVQLEEMFITMLSDNQKARQEDSHGNYEIVAVQETPLNSQEFFYKQAYLNAENVNS